MASVTSQFIEEVTAHAQNDSLEDAREICADGTYFPNNLRIYIRGVADIVRKICLCEAVVIYLRFCRYCILDFSNKFI